MKRTLTIAACVLTAASLWARMPEASDVTITGLKADHEADRLNIAFNLDFSRMPKGINNETRLIPVVKSGNDSIRLQSITLAGRNRLIQAKRTGTFNNPDTKYYNAKKTKTLPYETSVAWQNWMENADIDLVVENVGCCESRKTIADRSLARLDMGERTFNADLVYVTPVEERVKMRNAKGEAYIDFVVNTVNIRPDYRNNPAELRKIRATIDSVKADPDTKITLLTVTGYASPEGSYAGNEKLAKGRTEALAEYVRNLYTFPKNLMKTSWVAEDWAGLRKMVEGSEMAKKDAILAIIDSNMDPDVKDRKIATDFPVDYKYMLANWYPALRHSDYTVEYEVRNYTDPAEIAKVFRKNPSKLSLREFFIYAETLDPNSPEYADVFETAAKMYPSDPTANLNAGNTAMNRGDLTQAANYLAKAGDTPQAVYARAILAAKQGDYTKAAEMLAK
ncbi:MAG: hypothetical protein K2J70_06695, partial [Muribaculaceae bacterium]|nr:hypothetical protein [Muribaculaceae bacterium]